MATLLLAPALALLLAPPSSIDPPSGPGAVGPNLSVTSRGILLSWLEPGVPGASPGSGTWARRYAVFDQNRWSAPRTVVSSEKFFVNWADFPSIVEGAGGLLVRLDTYGGTLLDLASALAAGLPDGVRLEVVVVSRAGLGTLNHTELTVGALRAHGLEPAGLLIGSWPAAPGLAERCNRDDLPRVTDLPVLAVLPEGAGALSREEFLAAAPDWFDGAEAPSA